MKIGEKIKILRKKHGLTQKGLADILKISTSSVIKYERDEREPNLQVLIQIAGVLNLSLEELVKDTDKEHLSTNLFYSSPTNLSNLDSEYYGNKHVKAIKQLMFGPDPFLPFEKDCDKRSALNFLHRCLGAEFTNDYPSSFLEDYFNFHPYNKTITLEQYYHLLSFILEMMEYKVRKIKEGE
jgi:transcriptional regulator with XRE-family HTH domain